MIDVLFHSLEKLKKFKLRNTKTDIPSQNISKQTPISTSFDSEDNKVAIIGMAGSLPGGSDLETFWLNNLSSHNAITGHNRSYILPQIKAGFIEPIDKFDPSFFNISPLEAMSMDPQQRLLMQTTWHALEDAGYTAADLENKKVGVYIAVTGIDYYLLQRNHANCVPYTLPGFSHAMLSNRLSYFFNWQGPSVTVDTACSGSLIALGKGYQDLVNHQVDFAIVGSVNVLLDQSIFNVLEISRFLSPNFRCATFDEAADGYVRGEGVGCVLLRRKKDALLSKDNYHGTIVSYAENHGGRAISLTAPNPEAQKALLKKVYSDKDLASQISYIETHGTGTKLGDPIEIEALKSAWSELGLWNTKQNIRLGSIKTYIGHLEPMAGMASLLKILLCFKHKQLTKNLHFNRLNPFIEIQKTPFSILNENQNWETQFLRTAGISSFGFGGSNAHVVLQEPVNDVPMFRKKQKPEYLICISAKNKTSLNQLKNNLCLFLEKNLDGPLELELENIAYTLNAGRTHFGYRLAFIVKNLSDWHEQLRVSDMQDCVEITPLSLFKIDTVNLEIWKQAYLNGHQLIWSELHKNEQNKKISLPTYAFDMQSYWFEEQSGSVKKMDEKVNSYAKDNESRIKIDYYSENVYKISILESHVWLSEHIVKKEKMLPGVAHLAIAMKVAKLMGYTSIFGFSNVQWIQPIIFGKDQKDQLEFFIQFQKEKQNLNFSILVNEKIHSQGTLLLEESNFSGKFSEKFSFNSQKAFKEYNKEEIYALFEKSRIEYGPFFKGIEYIKTIDEKSCFSKIKVSEFIDDVHTNVLDASFQTILGLSLSDSEATMLPFSVGHLKFSLEYINAKPEEFYVGIEKISTSRVNLYLYDSTQKNILSILDLGVRTMPNLSENQKEITEWQKLIFKPTWEKVPIEGKIFLNDINRTYLILYPSSSSQWSNELKKHLKHSVLIAFEDEDCINKIKNALAHSEDSEIWIIDGDSYGEISHKWLYHKLEKFMGILQALEEQRSVIPLKVISNKGWLIDEYDPSINPNNSLLSVFAQAFSKETLHFKVCVISIDKITSETVAFIQNEKADISQILEPIIFINSTKYIRKIKEYRLENILKGSAFRNNGTYLIIGGLGGLGNILSEYLVKNYQANLVLIGRKKIDNSQLQSLKNGHNSIFYEQVDLTNEEELTSLFLKYPKIQGIIHSALVLQDKTIQMMTKDILFDVLDPKVRGTINLLNVLKKINKGLDFILFFSSMQSFLANAGQANYASACMFKDTLAHLMRNFYMFNTKIINWGYWGNIGIVASSEYRQRMEKRGIGSIEAEEGLNIIEALLQSDVSQIAVIKAKEEALIQLNMHREQKYHAASDQSMNQLLDNIVPIYDISDNQVLRNQTVQQYLEQYTRYAVRLIELPHNYQEKYQRLITAIKNMPVVPYINKSDLMIQYPEIKSHINFIDHCLSFYPEVLTGKLNHMNVLFPEGSFELVEKIYRDNPTSDYFNQVVAKIVENFVKEKKLKRIKIIEIGAGTGSTTQFVLPEIKIEFDYYFTDLSIAFLKKAQENFSKYTTVTYQVYDIEKMPPGVFVENFDIVIATNVLHATADIRNTLSNVKKLLKNEGILILNEVTDRQDFATVTFGLTTGWWVYTDGRIPDSPLLSSDVWKTFLKEINFSKIKSHGPREQQVIVAQKIEQENTKIQNSIILSKNETSFPTESEVKEKLTNFIVDSISNTMKIPLSDVKINEPFSSYGIDSLIALQLLKPFQDKFGYLPSTIFFEYPTIAKLQNYFYQEHKATVHNIFLPTIENKIPSNEVVSKSFELQDHPHFNEEDLAIVGVSGVFPGADNCDEFWENLKKGISSISKIPEDRWNIEDFFEEDGVTPGKMYTKFGGFVKNIDCFDNTFFGITPFDAENIDPQERLFLQTTQHAIEDAGLAPRHLAGKEVGVFVGVMNGGYGWLGTETSQVNWADSIFFSIANRVSYFFDWSGPSLAIDSACSSSLSALHMASLALKNNECELAIVGGVNLIVHPRQYTKLCRLRMLSSGDQCKSFGKDADGFVDGEGVISIVIKKYSVAKENNDRIYGIIKGTAINAGGRSNGYTAPNPVQQARVIAKALERAKVKPEEITYVEAHGTGTELGDPIEVRGLVKAFQSSDKQICALGSVKSNIGHLESAAGLAGLVKVLFQMKHKQIVASLNSREENEHLKLNETPFFLSKELVPWENHATKTLRSLVSSFGAGGSNSCVVLEEEKNNTRNEINYNSYIIVVSAKTLGSLQAQLDNLRTWLERKKHALPNLYQIAYGLACCRDHYKHRVYFVVSSIEELVQALQQDLEILLERKTSISEKNDLEIEKLINLFVSNSVTKNEAQLSGENLGKLYQQGVELPWDVLYSHRTVISLPGYAFEKRRHWIDQPKYGLSLKEKYLQQHKLEKISMMPATFSIALISNRLPDVHVFENMFWLKAAKECTSINVNTNDQEFLLESHGTIFARGQYRNDSKILNVNTLNDLGLNSNYNKILDRSQIYEKFSNLGYHYGEVYQKLHWVKVGDYHSLGAIENLSWSESFLDPSVLDAGLQIAITPYSLQNLTNSDNILVPFSLEKLTIYQKFIDSLIFCYCKINRVSLEVNEVSFSLYYTDYKKRILLSCENLISKVVSKANLIKSIHDLIEPKNQNKTLVNKEKPINFKAYKLFEDEVA